MKRPVDVSAPLGRREALHLEPSSPARLRQSQGVGDLLFGVAGRLHRFPPPPGGTPEVTEFHLPAAYKCWDSVPANHTWRGLAGVGRGFGWRLQGSGRER